MHETGSALRAAGVAVTEFRAGTVVGSGSLSFEIVRYLTERVPVMICPRWVNARVQPIAVPNVLDDLTAVLERPEACGKVIEIEGADVRAAVVTDEGHPSLPPHREEFLQLPDQVEKLPGFFPIRRVGNGGGHRVPTRLYGLFPSRDLAIAS